MESDHTDQWEVLSESSTTDSFHVTSKIKIIGKNDNKQENKTVDNDDNYSVHSIQSLESSLMSETGSIINVNASPTTNDNNNNNNNESQNLIPEINENKEMKNNTQTQNELIPSYIDIESELQQQRQLVNELKNQLNIVTNERDQVSLFFCFVFFLILF